MSNAPSKGTISLRLALVGSVFIFVALAAICSAQALEWKSIPLRPESLKIKGHAGGEGMQYVYAIAYAPSNPSIAYFAVDQSQVWKSSDGGFSWRSVNKGFMAHGARSIIVDPVNADTVYAAGFLGYEYDKSSKYKNRLQGIYRSTNGGSSWTLVKQTDFYRQESKGCLFAFDSSSTKAGRTPIVYAGSYDEGLLRSEDGGDTWRSIGFQGQHIIDIKENPAGNGELIVATEDGLYKYSKGVKSKIGDGLPSWPRSIAVGRQKPFIYAALGEAGVFKSTDGGAHFFYAGKGLHLLFKTNFTDIAVSPVNSDFVYVKAHLSSLKPFYSHDGAKSWHVAENTNLGNLLPDEDFWFSSPIAPHPTEAGTALTVSNGRARILKTLDGGRNWSYSGNGFTGGRMFNIDWVGKEKMVFFLYDHGLWLTDDGGSTFKELQIKRNYGLKSSSSGAVRGNTIIASVGTWVKKGLELSYDVGKTWKIIPDIEDYFYFIAFHPKQNNLIYAGPYRSGDNGKTWVHLSQTIRAMYPSNGDIVYSVAPGVKNNSRILKSIDKGELWTSPYPELPFSVESVNGIAIAPDNPDRIYVASSSGLWIYNGEKWISRNFKNGLDKDSFGLCYISSVCVDPNDPKKIYAGRKAPGYGESNGIFFSKDSGMTWRNITSNLGPGLTIWSIRISPFDSSVYIGTSLGTWKYMGSN